MRGRWARRVVVVGALALVPIGVNGVPGPMGDTVAAPLAAAPTLAGCPMLPADNIWNARVDSLPVHPRSAAYLSSIGLSTGLKADFGSGTWNGGPIGIPFTTVPGTQPRVTVRFEYADESDPGPYPIPPDAPVEGGQNSDGDRHVLVVDRDNCVLYELFSAYRQADGSWDAGSGAIFPLNSNALRPAGWTSADAAGLPILPGLVRYDEVAAGEIAHAIRFTAQVTQRAYVWPGRHYASSNTNPDVPPMGIRVRLKSSFNIGGFSPHNRVILQALKTYGMMLADNGSNWYISGIPDSRWSNDDLRALGSVVGSNLEVVDASSLMADPNSGRVAGGSTPPTATATPTRQPTATRTPTPAATATRAPTPAASSTRTPTPSAIPAATATATATSTGQTQTLVIRGAGAMPDTWISPDYPRTNFGSAAQAHLQGSYTPDRLLFLAGLAGLPNGATVQSATLEVYAYQANSSGNTLAAHQILRSWSPSSATYRQPWAQAGMRPGTDYAATPVGTATVGGVGWLSVDVTPAVQAWQTGTPNRGLMLRQSAGAPNGHYWINLAEHGDQSLRPKLTIRYR
jgi:hypothetical protein